MTYSLERQLAFLLVLLQAGIALLTALGAFVGAAAGFPGDAVFGVLQLVVAVGLVGLGFGFVIGSRRVARLVLLTEIALFLLSAPPALVGFGVSRDLAPVAVNLGLPLLVALLAGGTGKLAKLGTSPAPPSA